MQRKKANRKREDDEDKQEVYRRKEREKVTLLHQMSIATYDEDVNDYKQCYPNNIDNLKIVSDGFGISSYIIH